VQQRLSGVEIRPTRFHTAEQSRINRQRRREFKQTTWKAWLHRKATWHVQHAAMIGSNCLAPK
jgi:hypothetical protein